MIGLLQRVSEARVTVADSTIGEIDSGLLILLGVEKHDTPELAVKLADKVCRYRMFSDDEGKMNLNVSQAGGSLLVVSQFTLVADTAKGNRPGFSRGAPPELGNTLYERFCQACRDNGLHCETGQFGADMQVSLVNDGPVTFTLQV